MGNGHESRIALCIYTEIARAQQAFRLIGNWRGLLLADLEHGQEGLLRNVHLADPLHALLAFFLLFQQLALAADIASIALGDDVLADGGDGLSRDDLASDGRLNGDLEHLPR